MVNSPNTKRAFAARLRRLMMERGWNQSELARRAQPFTTGKMGRSNISVYIRAKSLPSPTHLHALARALEVEMTELEPSIVQQAEEVISERKPFEMSSVPNMPNRVHLRIDETLSFDKALKIVQILKDESDSTSDQRP